jgi:hypothetical protein
LFLQDQIGHGFRLRQHLKNQDPQHVARDKGGDAGIGVTFTG